MMSLVKSWVIMLAVTILVTAAQGSGEAIVYPYTLYDTIGDGVMEEFDEYINQNEGLHQFKLQYWIEQTTGAGTGGIGNTDTFYYALLTTDSPYADFFSLFESMTSIDDYVLQQGVIAHNHEMVDIIPINEAAPVTVVKNFTPKRYVYTFLQVANGNPLVDSAVHLEYSLQPVDVSAVPEPATVLLLGGGLAAFWGISRRKRH